MEGYNATGEAGSDQPNRGERRRQQRAEDRAARITEAVDILCDGVVEIRALDGRWTHSGYYDTSTPEGVSALVRDVLQIDGTVGGIYFTLNTLDPRCLRRSHNRMRMRVESGTTTSDSNIIRRRKFPLDFDVKRPADTSATDTEVEAAVAIATETKRWLIAEFDIPEDSIIFGMTGNGACLLVEIDEPNDDATRTLIQRAISAVAFRWNTAAVQLDPKVFNAARIWRLPGTTAAKGDPRCPDTQHRRAEILEAAASRSTCPRSALERLATTLPTEEKADTTSRHNGAFDLGEWISGHGVAVRSEGPWEDGWRWRLKQCLTDSTHEHGEAYIVRRGHGGIAAGCQHASCTWTWRDLRLHHEPGCYDEPRSKADRQEQNRKATGGEQNGSSGDAGRFKFITDDQLESLELPAQLIEGLIFEGSHVMIVGDPGSLKSFLALDWAYHIVRGQRWAGRAVKQGSVLYVLAEGKGQFKLRTLAWKQVNDA